MSESDKHQRTEEATPRKREKARGDGQVAKSPDLVFALALLASGGLLRLTGPLVARGFEETLGRGAGLLRSAGGIDLIEEGRGLLLRSLAVALPLLLGLVPVVVVGTFAQIGVHLHTEKLRLRPEKLLPNLSPSRFVNARSLVETLTSVLKLALLTLAAWGAVFADAPRVLELTSLAELGALASDLSVRLLLSVGAMLLAIGFVDLLLKRRNLDQDLRMTKEEVKQEMKDSMGDPEVRGRIRRQQRELAVRRMMDAVPDASVVVTNPTHYAVALRYEQGDPAPTVVAKGKDFVAQRIREIAREAGVPLVENAPLARTLHATVEVGDEIPPDLYQAVAEVLAAILRTRKRLGRTA